MGITPAPAVRFNHVSKRFRRGEIHDSLRDLLASTTRRILGRTSKESRSIFWALDGVCFEAAPGKALGIIGPNGAGKSTALKLLAGILRPDKGAIEVRGRLSALIEVGAGLHGDLTGMENIYLNGAIMGMTKREIDARRDEIIAFSGLEDFIDTPVKRYSTGMQARLGFSTAAHVQPDIMLVDEVLSVGDVAFRHRCEERMNELVHEGATLIFVTHNLEQMRAVCDEAIVLDGGRRAFMGSPAEAVGHYLAATMHRIGEMSYADRPGHGNGMAEVVDMRFLDEDGREIICAKPDDPLRIQLVIRMKQALPRVTVETNWRRMGGELIVSLNSRQQGVTFNAPVGTHELTLTLPELPLAGGNYCAHVRIWDADQSRLLVETPYRYTLQVDDEGRGTGLVTLRHDWSELTPLDGATTPSNGVAKQESHAPRLALTGS